MNKAKKSVVLILSLMLMFVLACGFINVRYIVKAEDKNAMILDNQVSAEMVDCYLRNNGYRDEFIAAAGDETKLYLYQQGAVFESEKFLPENSLIMRSASDHKYDVPSIEGDWTGFGASLTVSDVSNENDKLSAKILTLTWRWFSSSLVKNDAVAFTWVKDYEADFDSALFEIRASGNKIKEYIANPNVPGNFPPVIYNAQFAIVRGESAVSSLPTDRFEGVGYRFAINYGATTRQYFASGSYAEYQIDPDTITGSYSVRIQKKWDPELNDSCMAVANYFRWTHKVNIDFNFSFSVALGSSPGIKLKLTPDVSIEEYYQKSRDLVRNYNNFD